MDNLQFILTVIVPTYALVTFIAIFLGIWFGHKITMKAFSHVQPSTKEMTKMMDHGSVTQEPDWFDESQKDSPELSKDEEGKLKEEFKKTGLPVELFESYAKNGRHPQEFFGYDVPYSGVEEEVEENLYDVTELRPKEEAA